MRSVKPPPKKPNGPGTERRPRGEKPKDKQNFPIRPPGFSFSGCWHCGSTGHTRSNGRDGKGAKCPGFTEVTKKANPGVTDRKKMKLPAAYQGAYEKTLIAAGGKPRRLNMLDDEDLDDSDSESDFDTPITPRSIRALTAQTLTYDI